MEIKLTTQGLLIYLTMTTYVLAFVLTSARRLRAGWAVYACGFVVACGSLAARWLEVGHAPLRSMYEVFLVLAALVFPLSVLTVRAWRAPGHRWDMLTGVALLVPAGFVMSAVGSKLPPPLQTPLFIPHVMAYMLAYVLLAKAAILAIPLLAPGRPDRAAREAASHKVARLGMVFLTGGLILGAWWAKLAWGRFWGWDPKEMASLATWLIYVAYFHFRALYGRRLVRANAALLLAGLAAVVFTLLAVSYLRALGGIHSYAT